MLRNLCNWAVLLPLFLFTFLTGNVVLGQDPRCGTMYMDSVRRANDPNGESLQDFENWLEKLVADKEKLQQQGLIIDGVYQIPVVFHIIHNNQAVGTGDNLSQAIVQSQLDVLNEDFRKMFGSAGYNTHPDGADTKIEFCMARRRPDGSAFPGGEDGINRINRTTPGWSAPPYTTAYVDGNIKPWCTGTQFGGWSPARYMNIWVCQLSGGVLGYAQFPTTILGGMSCASQSVTTDGVVFTTNSIGKSAVTGFPGPYNEGRTATHEIGHWLGLRHIWGDGNCSFDDYCADTPLSDAPNFGCPVTNSCTDPNGDPNDMVENYMDYTDDLCMNIFTYDQMTRMRTVLENSPIRASLITSDACIPPSVNDASIIDILAPEGDNCPGSITPQVTIRNRGSANLTNASIRYTIDGGAPVNFNWTGNVASGAQTNVNLPAFTTTLGTHTIKAYSVLPNGVTDPDPTYDTTTLIFAVSNGYQPNYGQDFEGGQFPPDVRWLVDNPNSDCYEWVGQGCTGVGGVYPNDAALMPNFGNATGQDEYLYTPYFILPCGATSAAITFSKAYRRRANTSTDRLRLEMSEDCGVTWTTIWDQSGTTLQTVTTVSNTFWVPAAGSEWANVNVSLNPYISPTVSKRLQFRFRGTNQGTSGGNIYVDNVNVTAVTPAEIEVTVAGADVLDGGYYSFGSTTIGSTTTATFTVTNTGNSTLTLTPPITLTGSSMFTLGSTFGSTSIPAGGSTTFTINFTPTGAGPYIGNVSFGTNDCDEGTYNFELNGSGNASPPVASFTAAPTTVCSGSTVTYTSTSTNASTWTWSFPGGTPNSATGVGPHTITYNTPGTYNAQLTVTNAFGSDVELQSNLITVLSGTGVGLPITEGFVSATFPPTNWSISNGGTAVTWIRSATSGNAPTAGNSASIDNFTTSFAGAFDDLNMPGANFSSLTSAQLQFDVAYARYNATYFDQLDVLVSDDCGQTWTTVYSKAGTVLATDPDQTTIYSPGTWRTETVDLSAFVGSPKVEVKFRNISGYGQRLFIDNVNLTGVNASAIANFTAAPNPACVGQTVTFTNTSTGATSWSWNFGAGATPATATGAGPHNVTYASSGVKNVSLTINGGASTSNQTVTINANPATPTITAGGPTTFCTGGSVTLTSSSATGNVWSTGATTQSITVSTAGSYTVTVTNGSGCSSTSAATVVTVNANPATPTITAGGPTTFCTGGSVTLTSSSATGNLWSTGATTQSITVSASGSYTVTVTNGAGCSATSAATVVTVNANPATPTITAGGPTTFCTGGSVTLTSSSATGNLWSTGATTQSITVSTAGSYTVTVTNGAGCSATSAATVVTVNANPTTPTITAGGPTTFCTGGSVTLTSSSATGNLWSTGATTQSITVSSAGSYTVTVTNGVGCSATSAATVVTLNANPAAPTITAGGPTTFCSGGSVTLTSSSATGNLWSNGATSQTITVSTTGSYTVTVTNGAGCSATSAATAVTVNANPATPTITAGGPTTFCTGGSVTLTSSSATGNLWSTGATTQSISVSTAGSYTVTVTNGAGCSATSAATVVTVNANPATPTITASGSTTFCAGQSVNLTSSSATGNMWSTSSTSQTINVTTSGSYTVTVTNGAGCSATSAATTVTVVPVPNIAVGTVNNPTTCGTSTGSIQVTGSGSGTVSWSGTASGNSGVVTLPYTITGLTAGSYTISFSNGTCTSNTLNQVLTDPSAPPAPTITASGPTTFCAGGSVTLTSSQATGNTWSTGATTASIVVNSSGSYSVTFTDLSGCSSTSTATIVTVNANPAAPTITAGGPTTFCAGSSVNLTSSQGTGNLWSTSATSQTITVSAAGSYSVTYTDGNSCSASSAPVLITVNANPAAPTITAGGPTTFCAGGSVALTSSQASGNLWSTSATSQSINVTTSGAYTVTYTDGNGCSATSAPTTVTVNANPAAPTISASGPTTFCTGGSVSLTSSQSSGNTWSTAATTQTITVTSSGSYTVSYTDGNGCSATSAPTVVTVSAAPVISLGTVNNPSACGTPTGSIQVNGTGSGIVNWTGTASGTSGTVSLPYTISGLSAGSYSISYSNGCTSNTLTQTLVDPSAPAAPVITSSGSTTFCAGGSVTLTSSYATGNLWSNGSTSQSIVVTNAGSYSVTYTSGAGCSATSAVTTVTVNANPAAPTISAGGPTTFCTGGSVNLTSSQASGNVWSSSSTAQTINVSSSGSYTVTYTDGNGCSATSAPTLVTVNASPATPIIIASGATSFCSGGSVDLTASQASGVVWSGGATSQTITVNASGSYTVTYTDGNGCSATSAPTLVTVFSNPVAPVVSANGATSFCSGGSVDLSSSYATGNAWSNSATTQSITVTTSGSYTVTYTDGNGCSATSAPTLVTVYSAPATPMIMANGPTVFCDGDSVQLSSSQASGNEWSNSETTQDIVVYASGNYTVTYTDGNGCSATSAPLNVTVNALPSVSLGVFSTVCSYVSPFSMTGGIPAGGVYSGPGVSSGTFDPAAAGVGVHTITYTYIDGNGCSNSAQNTLEVEDCSGISDLTALGIVMYPNPTFGELSIESKDALIESVRVMDASGRLVFELVPRTHTLDLDLQPLSAGMYMVEITTGSAQARTQLIKQ